MSAEIPFTEKLYWFLLAQPDLVVGLCLVLLYMLFFWGLFRLFGDIDE